MAELIDSFYDKLDGFFGPLSSLFCLPTYKGMCPFSAWNYIQIFRTAAQPYFTAFCNLGFGDRRELFNVPFTNLFNQLFYVLSKENDQTRQGFIST